MVVNVIINDQLSNNRLLSNYFSYNFFKYFCNNIFAKQNRSLRLGVRTPGFHPGNRGSIPLGTATFKTHHKMGFF